MVHALNEIWRVLMPGGFLIDLRPFNARWPVEIFAGDTVLPAGLIDDTQGFPDSLAANNAIEQIVAAGLFTREQHTAFTLYSYWDSAVEFKTYMDENSTATLPPDTLAQAEQLLAQHGPDVRVRTRLHMMIDCYRKLAPS